MENLHALTTSPFFAPLGSALSRFQSLAKVPSLRDLNDMLLVDGIKFIAQGQKPAFFEEGYEPRIFLRGEVQTRAGSIHDFFNALVWQQFPKTKRAINHLHYYLQKARFPLKERLPPENMLTIFDEHGVIALSKNADLLKLIFKRRWHELFWQRREQTKNELKFIIFGHGLYEKILKHPFVGMCAHSLLLHHDLEQPVDRLVAEFLLQKGNELRTKDLTPIPILGYPGWWPANEDEAFYANERYFRS